MGTIGPYEIAGGPGRGCAGIVQEARAPRSRKLVAVEVPHEAVRTDLISLERVQRHAEHRRQVIERGHADPLPSAASRLRVRGALGARVESTVPRLTDTGVV